MDWQPVETMPSSGGFLICYKAGFDGRPRTVGVSRDDAQDYLETPTIRIEAASNSILAWMPYPEPSAWRVEAVK